MGLAAGTIAQLHRSSDFDKIGRGTIGRAPIASALFVLAAVMVSSLKFELQIGNFKFQRAKVRRRWPGS